MTQLYKSTPLGLVPMSPSEQAEFEASQVSPPTPRTRADVLNDLAEIDRKSIRPLRDGDNARLATLEAQAVALRVELAGFVRDQI